jgi:hypothetical protein
MLHKYTIRSQKPQKGPYVPDGNYRKMNEMKNKYTVNNTRFVGLEVCAVRK